MRRALVGSDRLGSGCLVLRADTRENPGGKNGVMTGSDVLHTAPPALVLQSPAAFPSSPDSLSF
jgi:hypothetical protein